MTTEEAANNSDCILDALTRASSQVEESLENWVSSRRTLRRATMPKRESSLLRLWWVELQFFFAGKAICKETQRLASCFNKATFEFDGDEGLALLKKIASHCGSLVRNLEKHRRLRQRLRLSPLNGAIINQLENLICELEDVGEAAALSASSEVTAIIMKQLAVHNIAG